MKLIESTASFGAQSHQHRCASRSSSDEDEGVCDLEVDPDELPTVRVQSLISRTPPRAIIKPFAKSRAAKGETPLVKEKLINLTQSKLKTVEASDSLRNKVLLESALKRCLTQTSTEKRNKLLMMDAIASSTSDASDLTYSVYSSSSDSNHAAFTPRMAPGSPRKRYSSESISEVRDMADLALKRRKAFFSQQQDEQDCPMDVCSDNYSSSVISKRNECFADDLSSVFYRMHTQQ